MVYSMSCTMKREQKSVNQVLEERYYMNALELIDVTKEYKDFTLDHLSLTLPAGCIMGLIGENGAGKSTTIKLILGMIHKNEGTIRIYGKDAGEASTLVKEDIGVVMDDNGIPAALDGKKIDKVMKRIYKNWNSGYFMELLQKMSVPVNKKYGDFSRGMKMKMGIAIALSHDPKLLILDEATNGLDPVAKEEVLEMLFDFTREEDHSILISSHIVSDLEKLCDYIAFLHKGKLILMEEKDKLFEEYGVMHISRDQMETLDPKAIIGKRVSSYGAEVLIKRNEVPTGSEISPINIEDLFVFMVKGGN